MKRNRKQIALVLVTWAFFFLMPKAKADSDDVQARDEVQRDLLLVHEIEPFLERPDLARMHFLENILKNVLSSIDSGGASTFETLHYYHELILSFRYSKTYFNQIETAMTKDAIEELNDNIETLAKEKKFDEFVNTHITEDVYTQMQKLISQLLDSHTLPETLSDKLKSLMPSLGYVIAQARLGDVDKTFEEALPLYRAIEGLYPDFMQIGRSHSAFDILLEIQGLNEFYGSYRQLD